MSGTPGGTGGDDKGEVGRVARLRAQFEQKSKDDGRLPINAGVPRKKPTAAAPAQPPKVPDRKEFMAARAAAQAAAAKPHAPPLPPRRPSAPAAAVPDTVLRSAELARQRRTGNTPEDEVSAANVQPLVNIFNEARLAQSARFARNRRTEAEDPSVALSVSQMLATARSAAAAVTPSFPRIPPALPLRRPSVAATPVAQTALARKTSAALNLFGVGTSAVSTPTEELSQLQLQLTNDVMCHALTQHKVGWFSKTKYKDTGLTYKEFADQLQEALIILNSDNAAANRKKKSEIDEAKIIRETKEFITAYKANVATAPEDDALEITKGRLKEVYAELATNAFNGLLSFVYLALCFYSLRKAHDFATTLLYLSNAKIASLEHIRVDVSNFSKEHGFKAAAAFLFLGMVASAMSEQKTAAILFLLAAIVPMPGLIKADRVSEHIQTHLAADVATHRQAAIRIVAAKQRAREFITNILGAGTNLITGGPRQGGRG